MLLKERQVTIIENIARYFATTYWKTTWRKLLDYYYANEDWLKPLTFREFLPLVSNKILELKPEMVMDVEF